MLGFVGAASRLRPGDLCPVRGWRDDRRRNQDHRICEPASSLYNSRPGADIGTGDRWVAGGTLWREPEV